MKTILKFLVCLGIAWMIPQVVIFVQKIQKSEFSIISHNNSSDLAHLSEDNLDDYFLIGLNIRSNMLAMQIRAWVFHDGNAAFVLSNVYDHRLEKDKAKNWFKKACEWGSVYCKNGKIDRTILDNYDDPKSTEFHYYNWNKLSWYEVWFPDIWE